jgi:hypothetical protein
VRVGKQIVDERDGGQAQIGRHLPRIHYPGKIRRFHALMDYGARQPAANRIHRMLVHGKKLLNDLGQPRKLRAGKNLDMNRLQTIRRSLKKGKTAVGAADIARQDHQSLLQWR